MLPYFYQEQLNPEHKNLTLDEATSKHCAQVLRMTEGEAMLLTNGRGLRCKAIITQASRKHTMVSLEDVEQLPPRPHNFGVAIAFTKNNSRNEWLLEKATEIGIRDIFPIITKRSEKDKIKPERLNNILTAAMLQSQQVYLPQLHEARKLPALFTHLGETYPQRFVAHCEDGLERVSYIEALSPSADTLVLIGPEGDFTPEEIELAKAQHCLPVTFGSNRLRTETAGLYACTVFNAKNYG